MRFRFLEPFYLAAIAYGFVLEGINIMLIPQLLAQQVDGGEYYSGFILGVQAAAHCLVLFGGWPVKKVVGIVFY